LFDSAGGKPANYIAQWNGVVGINELTTNNGQVKVYPNPSHGKFVLESSVVNGQSSVEVYNMMGEKVAFSNFSQGGASKASSVTLPSGGQGWALDLSSQPAGIYMYRILSRTGQLEASGKLIIQ
jgi:hypothetical protein